MTTRIKSAEPEAVIDPSGGTSGNALPLSSNSKKNSLTNVYKQTRKVPKTNSSATPKTSFKSPEDMYDEIMELKKSMSALAEENTTLKTRLRRVEDDNAKKNDELRRTIADKKSSASAVVNSMRQKVFKLEQALKEKDTAMKKLQSDMKVTRAHEMKVQMETYYQEILRLKNSANFRKVSRHDNASEEQNGNNNNESLSKENKAITEQLAAANKTLQEEVAALRKDLSRALSIDQVSEPKGDYVNLNKDELLNVVTVLEEKLQNAVSHNADNENNPLSGGFNEEKAKLDAMILKLREDRLYYHELAQSKEQEVKVLKLLVEALKKERAHSSPSSASSRRIAPSSSLMTRKLNQDNSASESDTKSKPSARKSAATDSTAARTGQVKPPTNRRSVAASKNVKARSGSESETSKSSVTRQSGRSNGSETDSPRSFSKPNSSVSEKSSSGGTTRATPRSATKNSKLNASPTNKVSKDSKSKSNPKLTDKKPAARVKLAHKTASKSSSDEGPTSPAKTNTIEISSESTSVLENDDPATVEVKSAVTRTVISHTNPQEAAKEKNSSAPGSPSKKGSAFKSHPYTMVQAPNTSDAGRVQTAAGDPSENQRYDRVQTFRQNHAAKKIQKQWKQHQKEVTETQDRQVRLQKLEVIQHNRAARTIQRGWKKHTTDKQS